MIDDIDVIDSDLWKKYVDDSTFSEVVSNNIIAPGQLEIQHDEQIRANNFAQMKGSSSWVTALQLTNEGYVLTKRELFEAIYLRYR